MKKKSAKKLYRLKIHLTHASRPAKIGKTCRAERGKVDQDDDFNDHDRECNAFLLLNKKASIYALLSHSGNQLIYRLFCPATMIFNLAPHLHIPKRRPFSVDVPGWFGVPVQRRIVQVQMGISLFWGLFRNTHTWKFKEICPFSEMKASPSVHLASS